MTTLVWFRQDLRLEDNPALHAATKRDAPVIPVYVWSPEDEGDWPPGAASRWWTPRAKRVRFPLRGGSLSRSFLINERK